MKQQYYIDELKRLAKCLENNWEINIRYVCFRLLDLIKHLIQLAWRENEIKR